MERILGRALVPGEIVHHKDHDKRNNNPSNLMLISSQADHARLHSTKNRTCDYPGCDRKHYALTLCRLHYQRRREETKRGGAQNA